jgi:hypothetical protein
MRPVKPVPTYTDSEQYPAVIGPAPGRRRFLIGLLGGAAAGATAALLGSRRGHAETVSRQRVDLRLGSQFQFGGCDYVADRIIVQTMDTAMARFLQAAAELAGLQAAVLAALKGHVCADVTDRKRLATLEGKLGVVLAARYRTRTRRTTAAPIVTLVLTRRRPVDIDGGFGMPSVPVPRHTRRA